MNRRTVAAALALALAVPALGTTTWSEVATKSTNERAVKGANSVSTGTESAPATSTTTTAGLRLTGLKGVTVCVETTTGGNMTAGGKLLAYLWNPTTGKWGPIPDLDLTVAAVPVECFPGFTITADLGRFAMEPSGLGTTTDVYIRGATK